MLDFDLAALYEVETKRLKEAVRRNKKRFPDDFMFELSSEEYNSLRTQFATSNPLRSQIASSKRGGTRYAPFAFTEQGVSMLSAVLNSSKAIDVNISIMRAFVMMRQLAMNYKDLADKISILEQKYNKQFADVYEALDLLLQDRSVQEDFSKRKRIGYNIPKK